VPSTLQSLLVFALFIVPGFLLRAGYVRTRARGAADTALYAVAEAVVASSFLIAALWWWDGKTIVDWARNHQLAEHSTNLYEHALVLLLIPYPIGSMVGLVMTSLVEKLRNLRVTYGERKVVGAPLRFLDDSGVFSAPTAWDNVWNERLRDEGVVMVRASTKTGEEVVGQFGPGSWVGLSPEPRQVYLSQEYRPDGAGGWDLVPNTKGVFIDAEEVEFLGFADV
jgi:hypothetical protein